MKRLGPILFGLFSLISKRAYIPRRKEDVKNALLQSLNALKKSKDPKKLISNEKKHKVSDEQSAGRVFFRSLGGFRVAPAMRCKADLPV